MAKPGRRAEDLAAWHTEQAFQWVRAAETTAMDKPEPVRGSLLRLAAWHREQAELVAELSKTVEQESFAEENRLNEEDVTRLGVILELFDHVQPKSGKLLMERTGDHVAFSVPDDGKGIPVAESCMVCNALIQPRNPTHYDAEDLEAAKARAKIIHGQLNVEGDDVHAQAEALNQRNLARMSEDAGVEVAAEPEKAGVSWIKVAAIAFPVLLGMLGGGLFIAKGELGNGLVIMIGLPLVCLMGWSDGSRDVERRRRREKRNSK
jgi:hypothetical protein